MSADYCGKSTRVTVTVNQRALVGKVLARYPEDFAVFRELLQNAQDAGAKNVEIEFQTEDYAAKLSGDKVTNGTNSDFNNAKVSTFLDTNRSGSQSRRQVSKWVVRNDGKKFEEEDWNRITNIAVGNPDDQKIGAFGVGFFSVFSVTDSPVIISGDYRKKMGYNGDELVVDSWKCAATKWTIIEMEVQDERLPMPEPFDFSRFLCTAATFLGNVKKITVLFNGQLLSDIVKSRGVAQAIELPQDLKSKRDNGFMQVQSVQMIPQEVRVTLTDLAYSAGSKRSRAKKGATEKLDTDSNLASFFGGLLKKPEPHRTATISHTWSPTNVSVVKYTIYSAQISATPPTDIVSGLEAATKKKQPTSFLCEALHASGALSATYNEFTGRVEEREWHCSRLFIGQRTAQTSGSAIHLSGRFIPTVERGLIDLAHAQVAKWNAELLYVGGLLTRLIYEQAMKDIRSRWSWPESPSLTVDRLREEALYTMRCFTFRQSTPDSDVSQLLQDAFFNCSASQSFPILSNHGIRDSKDVREPHATFQPFMIERPILDGNLWPIKSTMIGQLPQRYLVTQFTFADVQDELKCRTFTEEEMIAFLGWWLRMYKKSNDEMSSEFSPAKLDTIWSTLLLPDARFHSSSRTLPETKLSTMKKFVDTRPRHNFLEDGDPLPPDTIPPSLTRSLDSKEIIAALKWEHLTMVDWIRYLVSPAVDPYSDICKDPTLSERVFARLGNAWPSMNDTDRKAISDIMQSVPCIPTSQGYRRPPVAYFPEVALFDDLPVLQLSHSYSAYQVVLDSLGVKRYLDWSEVNARLISDAECSMIRLVAYLQAVRPHMGDEFKIVEGLCIFACEDRREARRCIHELYRPDEFHRALGLPILHWNEETAVGSPTLDAACDILHSVGLQRHPPIDVIIQKASGGDTEVRKLAYEFFMEHLDDHYKEYNPADFSDSAFLPCGKGDKPEFGTPEQVFTSPEWEIFGFSTIHESVTSEDQDRLKMKQRPLNATIIEAMRKNPPTESTAEKWFEQAGRAGLLVEELADVSNMEIIPVQDARPAAPGTESAGLSHVTPNKCFYGSPDDGHGHHREIFTFVNYGEIANDFLRMCRAKPNPDCSDIVEAMIKDPQGYLEKIETQGVGTPAYKKYLDDLRQVAAGYHSFSKDLREQMSKTPMFIALTKKARTPGSVPGGEPAEYALKCAQEVLVADDLDSHRLFGELIFVAPKEEVFEKFYREHGSQSLSARVDHAVQPGPCIRVHQSETEALQHHVLERLEIFLHDQDSTRRSIFEISDWRKEGAFTVKFCETLTISKTLQLESLSQSFAPIPEEALAGIERTSENDTLWMRQQSENSKIDWYHVSVALCRIVFTTHKTHDIPLLTTILDAATLEDLKRRGYDGDYIYRALRLQIINNTFLVDAIKKSSDQQVQKAEQSQPEPEPPQNREESRSEPSPASFLARFKDPVKNLFRTIFLNHLVDGRKEPRGFSQDKMDDMVSEALQMCESDASNDPQRNQGKSKGGRKQRDVKHCDSRRTDLERCPNDTKNGMSVFKTPHSQDPLESELEIFSCILEDLGKVFGLETKKLHIFCKPTDSELMGFNRNKAIYLNLAHYRKKPARLGDHDSLATTYVAWYFIIAHELAHNKVVFHDEYHERLSSSIAQKCFIDLKKLVQRKAPNARQISI
ncbi:hypothetical protein PAXINDRAFT_100530 [Paxillus involutus ATCC 200175]|uniref:Sacsin/Nov domain-containing protein n=1 Tax=Paxillus involutus ATCC 200175 TaxID=664439 RepID=A0A0C9TE31_PAXIN|nr:hypothetical protein PAXINDRAFT_100530 [Paxillus involutus ATCC 200175]